MDRIFSVLVTVQSLMQLVVLIQPVILIMEKQKETTMIFF